MEAYDCKDLQKSPKIFTNLEINTNLDLYKTALSVFGHRLKSKHQIIQKSKNIS